MCSRRGISLPAKPRVGETRVELKSETVYKLGGRCNGMTFQEIALSDPGYLNWAKTEVQKKDGQQSLATSATSPVGREDGQGRDEHNSPTDQDAAGDTHHEGHSQQEEWIPNRNGSTTACDIHEDTRSSLSPEMAEMTEVMRSLAMTVGTLQRNVEELQQEKSRKTRSSASRSTDGFEKVEHHADAQ